MGKKPARKEAAPKKGARRLNITPDLKADVRRRYETTAEKLATMAADCGCCGETVRAMAKREGWVRFEPPPRDLSPAAKLRMKAEALSEQGGASLSLPPRSGGEGRPPELAPQAQADGVGGVESLQEPPTPDPSPPRAARAGGGEKKEAAGQETPASESTDSDPAVIAAHLLREVSGFLDDIRAARQRMKREGYAKHELQKMSRVIADCSASLARLQTVSQRAAAAGNAQQTDPETAQETLYDDVPADLDAFRDALARRIEAFLASRPDAGVDAVAPDDDAAAPRS